MSFKQVALKLRKDGARDVCVSGKPFVEGDQLVTSRSSKGSQERVVPNFGRKGLALCVAPPVRLDAGRFAGERDARIAEERVVHSPRVRQRHRFRAKCLRVRGQSEKSLLRQSAERAPFARQALEPVLGDRVMYVRFERQRQPQVDVRQKHRRLPEVPRGARRLDDGFLDDRTAPTVTKLGDVNRAVPSVTRRGTRRSPSRLPATATRLPEPRHRYALDLGFPYRHSRSPFQLNQVPLWGR